jgi:lysophospholipase L1-like esterase
MRVEDGMRGSTRRGAVAGGLALSLLGAGLVAGALATHPGRASAAAAPLAAPIAVRPWQVALAARAPLGDWTAGWTTALVPGDPTGRSGEGLHDQTVRDMVRISVAGELLRVRVSNLFGTATLHVGRVSVGRRHDAAALQPGSLRTATFGGAPDVDVPAGGEVRSDPVPFAVRDGTDLAVSVYVPGHSGAVTRHPRALGSSYLADGDATGIAGRTPYGTGVTEWWLLAGVDVRTAAPVPTVVAFGDSITDGVGSTPRRDRRWPTLLADRVTAAGGGLTVVDTGLSGNRVAGRGGVGSGVDAVARFDRDALAVPNVSTVLLLEGINDLRTTPRPAGSVIAGYQDLVTRAHARGIRVVAGTILPAGRTRTWSRAKEQARQEVNAWIRRSGAFDGVVDFDAVLRDPRHPDRLRRRYDSGDHLHPGDDGYAAMARAVPLSLLRGPTSAPPQALTAQAGA